MNREARKYVETTVLGNEIYMANSNSFNDPFDLNPVFSFEASKEIQIQDYIRLHKKYGGPCDQDLKSIATRVVENRLNADQLPVTEEAMSAAHREQVANVTGVYCVTTKPDNLLMWAHYGENHTGICLEFSDKLCLEVGVPMKVNYSTTRTPIKMYAPNPSDLFLSMCTKSSAWEYEDEWRIIRPEYDGGPGIATFSPTILTGIIIGAMASTETVDCVKNWARDRDSTISISRAILSKRAFALEIAPL